MTIMHTLSHPNHSIIIVGGVTSIIKKKKSMELKSWNMIQSHPLLDQGILHSQRVCYDYTVYNTQYYNYTYNIG